MFVVFGYLKFRDYLIENSKMLFQFTLDLDESVEKNTRKRLRKPTDLTGL